MTKSFSRDIPDHIWKNILSFALRDWTKLVRVSKSFNCLVEDPNTWEGVVWNIKGTQLVRILMTSKKNVHNFIFPRLKVAKGIEVDCNSRSWEFVKEGVCESKKYNEKQFLTCCSKLEILRLRLRAEATETHSSTEKDDTLDSTLVTSAELAPKFFSRLLESCCETLEILEVVGLNLQGVRNYFSTSRLRRFFESMSHDIFQYRSVYIPEIAENYNVECANTVLLIMDQWQRMKSEMIPNTSDYRDALILPKLKSLYACETDAIAKISAPQLRDFFYAGADLPRQCIRSCWKEDVIAFLDCLTTLIKKMLSAEEEPHSRTYSIDSTKFYDNNWQEQFLEYETDAAYDSHYNDINTTMESIDEQTFPEEVDIERVLSMDDLSHLVDIHMDLLSEIEQNELQAMNEAEKNTEKFQKRNGCLLGSPGELHNLCISTMYTKSSIRDIYVEMPKASKDRINLESANLGCSGDDDEPGLLKDIQNRRPTNY